MIAIRILQKVLVNYFYKTNAGLFLFGFFILFGLPYSPLAFHVSLITGIIRSPVFLAIVLLIWFIYNLKCIDYMLKQLHNARQLFLFCFHNLSIRKNYLYMLYVQALIFMPVLLYASVIVFFALRKQQYLCAVEVILFNTIIITASAYIYFKAIIKDGLFRKMIALPGFNINLPKPLFLIPLYFLWIDRKQMLLVTKLFSLLFLYSFFRLYEPERYDIRPMQLCLLLTCASHSAIIFEIRTFEEEYMTFSKNLPLTTVSRFLIMAGMYCCLLLPEFVFLFKGYPIQFILSDYPQLILFVVALSSLFHVVLLLEDLEMEQLIRTVFGITAGCFFIILYNPGFIFSCAILLLSFALFNSYYYSFEKKQE